MTTLSVVIPTHHRPKLLERVLVSIYASDSVEGMLEVVVVNDGSPAGEYDAVSARFPAVVWVQQRRRGPAAARNRGWRAAAGEAVAFIDDDCVLAPGALHHLQQELKNHDAVGGRIEPLKRGRMVADYMQAEHLVTHKVDAGQVRWLVTACLIIRRPILDQLGGFDERFSHGGEDADLSLRLRKNGFRLAIADKAVVAHDHRSSLLQLVRTYYRHGTAQRYLTSRHPERRGDLARSARSRLSPPTWLASYRTYRATEDVLTSAAFIVLRSLMMIPWIVGAYRGPTVAADD